MYAASVKSRWYGLHFKSGTGLALMIMRMTNLEPRTTTFWQAAGQQIARLMKRKKLYGSLLVTSLALITQACAPQTSPQNSCNFVMSGDSQRVSWGPAAPVILYVDSSVPSEFFDAIRTAVMTWNQSLGREVLKVGGWSSAYPLEKQDGVNVIYFNKSWSETQREKQAVTTIWWAGDRVYEADIRVNGVPAYFQYFWGPTPIPGRVDFESLILHELGHVLGLEHPKVEVAGTVMARRLNDGQLRRTPTYDDIGDLKCEY